MAGASVDHHDEARYRRLPAMGSLTRRAFLVLAVATAAGCNSSSLLGYIAWPNYPAFHDGQRVELPGLLADVEVTQRSDGLWRVHSSHETDGMRVLGYLQARDRMAQLDIFRHLARGELAQLVGLRDFGGKSTLDVDRLNRFLGFSRDATTLYEATSAEERKAFDAFVAGINLWIAEGRTTLEHRLLGGGEVRPWTAEDSLAIYLMVMHGLGSNADREVRRLAIACSAGLEAMERIWPTDIAHDVFALPEDDLGPHFSIPPALTPELVAELPRLCGSAGQRNREAPPARAAGGILRLGSALSTLSVGWSASNNWVVAGQSTRSTLPVLSTDPHLPHMNPPMAWGFDFESPDYRTAGFTLPGLYRVVFGHNGAVAWGATTNHVDRQDLVVHRPSNSVRDGAIVGGYEVDGRFQDFDVRTERFHVRGGESVDVSVRYTRDGPLLNDLTDDAGEFLPLVALRVVPIGRGGDLDGARGLAFARSTREFAAAIDLMDLGCFNWLAADDSGSIAYRAPCLVPVRQGWSGAFPIPGWLTRYHWKGYVPKEALPRSFDPARGWLATANNQIVPADRWPTTYNSDVSGPARFERIVELLSEKLGHIDTAVYERMQMDRYEKTWPRVRAVLEESVCAAGDRGDGDESEARRILCDWDGEMAPDSIGATLFTLLTNALLDNALADELPGGADGDLWRFVQGFVQFEANAQWLWDRPADDPAWDDVRTPDRESRADIVHRALADAVATGHSNYRKPIGEWRWGEIRPFVLAHLFAGDGGVLGRVVNEPPLHIGGGTETLFKNQFLRSDRSRMRPEVGPIIRIAIDMAEPWEARFALAGGQSGWPLSPFYGNLLTDWATGQTRPLTPAADGDDVHVRFAPPAATTEPSP